MPDSLAARIVVVSLLLCAQGGLLVWYGNDPISSPYTNEYRLFLDYDRHVGERAVVDGTVVSTTPLVIERSFAAGSIRLRIRGTDLVVRRGDTVRAFGVVEPDRTVRAERAFVERRWGERYAVVVSVVGGLWVLLRLVRHWEFDATRWGLRLEKREDA
jgi:hypothetical protein